MHPVRFREWDLLALCRCLSVIVKWIFQPHTFANLRDMECNYLPLTFEICEAVGFFRNGVRTFLSFTFAVCLADWSLASRGCAWWTGIAVCGFRLILIASYSARLAATLFLKLATGTTHWNYIQAQVRNIYLKLLTGCFYRDRCRIYILLWISKPYSYKRLFLTRRIRQVDHDRPRILCPATFSVAA